MDQSILDKIRKLHALAENAGTEHEAALAASRVADLCRQHNLDIGVATLIEEEKTASEHFHVHDSSKWQAHWSYLALACDSLFDTAHYRRSRNVATKNLAGVVIGMDKKTDLVFYGLRANVQASIVAYEYLLASVEAMLESHIGELSGASQFRSFRLGCAERIYAEGTKIKRQLIASSPETEESTALVVMSNALIKAHYKAKGLSRSGHSAAGASSSGAYSMGYRAGGRVDIHGARSSRMLR